MDIRVLDYIEICLYLLILTQVIVNKRNRIRFRRWWTQPHLRADARQSHGAYHNIFRFLKLNNHEEFYKFVGLTVSQFDYVLNLVQPRLTKQSRRPALSPELRLAVVLNYLACGKNITQSSWFFRIGRSTMYKLIPEVCKAIYDALHETYLEFPKREDWLSIADGINNKFSFPNCLGYIDGKNIRIKAPVHSGSWFFNYKKFNSIVLMAATDAYRRFTWINVGDFGSLNDTGIFQNSDLGRALEANEVDIPGHAMLSNSNIECPYFFIADGGFPLRSYLLKPYIRTPTMSVEERIFNIRLSHARKIVECAFGVLCKRWRILESALDFNLRTTEIIIMSIVCLHNLIITDERINGDVSSDSENDNTDDDDDDDNNLNDDNDSDDTYNNDSDDTYNNDSDDTCNNDSDDTCNDNDNNINNGASSDGSDSDYDDNPGGEDIRRILHSYFVSPAGNVNWQWQKLMR